MGKIVDLNAHRPGWAYDEICGIWYDASGLPDIQPEIWVVTNEPGPGGVGTAFACFTSESDAKRYQLENGLSATTKLVRFD